MDNEDTTGNNGFRDEETAALYYGIEGRVNAEVHDLEDRIAEAQTGTEMDLFRIELRGVLVAMAAVRRAFGL